MDAAKAQSDAPTPQQGLVKAPLDSSMAVDESDHIEPIDLVPNLPFRPKASSSTDSPVSTSSKTNRPELQSNSAITTSFANLVHNWQNTNIKITNLKDGLEGFHAELEKLRRQSIDCQPECSKSEHQVQQCQCLSCEVDKRKDALSERIHMLTERMACIECEARSM